MTTQRFRAVGGSDGEALARVARGETVALGEVYDRHAEALTRFAIRLVGARDAEDVVQATFVRAAVIARSYDDRAPTARTWLFGIAVRIAQERRRAFARLTNAIRRLGETHQRAVVEVEVSRSDLQQALQELSPEKRAVLVLAEVEGFTCEEIARMLEVPIGTVWTRLHHARKAMRAYFEGDS
ncbi:RNA polymerase sigma-54 factor RpoN [Labilithrix luteola]|uniref:RNA polymerase sigma-54 factor RpoN n=1 Tax=Labilithrix luteola TaxID=1391654 RepID=A0A0K1PMX3_9BACT|nr:RNA polymerase sigma factor [Labilithrix luteola]AKU94878.1 RNA polymerase sigma-54 factor RpoN [Labilithrix luteola]